MDLELEGLGVEPDNLTMDGRTVTHQDDGSAELSDGGHRAGDDDGRAVVAAHRVHCDLHTSGLAIRVGHLHGGGVGIDYAPSTATISRPL